MSLFDSRKLLAFRWQHCDNYLCKMLDYQEVKEITFLARRTESRGSYCRTPGVRRRRCQRQRQRRRQRLVKVSL